MTVFRWLLPIAVVVTLVGVVDRAGRPPVAAERVAPADAADVSATVAALDRQLEASWAKAGLTASAPADDFTVARRVSLALHGTVPSLEELGRFRAHPELDLWVKTRLADRRFEEYFAERLARVVVGVDQGPFPVYRRDRLVDWLARELAADAPWTEIAQRLIAGQGLWTSRPETNFITATYADGKADPMKLASRTVRAFLGQRMDCAQCHDHPFASWKQGQFEGLAAFYGGVTNALKGITDGPGKLVVEDRKTLAKRTVEPAPPYQAGWMPAAGTPRERLATWLVDRRNRRFPRAIANRVWGFMFGKPYYAPVDDLPDPPSGAPDAIDVLADDLIAHGYSLRRLVRVIAGSSAFRLQSVSAETDPKLIAKREEAFAQFPLVRLRPEQVIGAMLQAASVKTVDRNANVLMRAIRFLREGDFVKHYGDFGDSELDERGGTIPQRLLMLNGKLVHELTEPNPFGATLRIAKMAVDDAEALDLVYRACLTRAPSDDERQQLAGMLQGTKDKARDEANMDLYWTLINSTEFSWNH